MTIKRAFFLIIFLTGALYCAYNLIGADTLGSNKVKLDVSYAENMIKEINDYRKSQSLPEYQISSCLTASVNISASNIEDASKYTNDNLEAQCAGGNWQTISETTLITGENTAQAFRKLLENRASQQLLVSDRYQYIAVSSSYIKNRHNVFIRLLECQDKCSSIIAGQSAGTEEVVNNTSQLAIGLDYTAIKLGCDFDANKYQDRVFINSNESELEVEYVYKDQAENNKIKIKQGQEGITGYHNEGDNFGQKILCSDFNFDGFVDMAISVPNKMIDDFPDVGAVVVIYGSIDGLILESATQFDPKILGEATVEQESQFGKDISTGDFNGDGMADLAIGCPGCSRADVSQAGSVYVLSGSKDGLKSSSLQVWDVSKGQLSELQENDNYGYSLASGDFDSDRKADLAIGIPNKTVNDKNKTGAVAIIYGSNQGLQTNKSRLLTQDSENIPGTAENGDRFGHALSSGDFNNDGNFDLVVGVPNEGSGELEQSGVINIFYGKKDGLGKGINSYWSLNSDGISSESANYDLFGSVIYSSDIDKDSYADILIGIPNKSISDAESAGAILVLYGNASGIQAFGNRIIYQEKKYGLRYSTGEKYGTYISSGQFDTDSVIDLSISTPNENENDSTAPKTYIMLGR